MVAIPEGKNWPLSEEDVLLAELHAETWAKTHLSRLPREWEHFRNQHKKLVSDPVASFIVWLAEHPNNGKDRGVSNSDRIKRLADGFLSGAWRNSRKRESITARIGDDEFTYRSRPSVAGGFERDRPTGHFRRQIPQSISADPLILCCLNEGKSAPKYDLAGEIGKHQDSVLVGLCKHDQRSTSHSASRSRNRRDTQEYAAELAEDLTDDIEALVRGVKRKSPRAKALLRRWALMQVRVCGKTQEEVANIIGVKQYTICRWLQEEARVMAKPATPNKEYLRAA